MKILLFNDTDHTWRRHAASHGPDEIPAHTGAAIEVYGDEAAFFVKVWGGMFLARPTADAEFARRVGDAISPQLVEA